MYLFTGRQQIDKTIVTRFAFVSNLEISNFETLFMDISTQQCILLFLAIFGPKPLFLKKKKKKKKKEKGKITPDLISFIVIIFRSIKHFPNSD